MERDEPHRSEADIGQAREVLQNLEAVLGEARDLITHLLELVGWTIFPAAYVTDRKAADLLQRILRAIHWALRLEVEMGKNPNVTFAFDDQSPLGGGYPPEDAWRFLIAQAGRPNHHWTRALTDHEVSELREAVQAADMAGDEPVLVAVRRVMPVDLEVELDLWAVELGEEVWPRLARNLRGHFRGHPQK